MGQTLKQNVFCTLHIHKSKIEREKVKYKYYYWHIIDNISYLPKAIYLSMGKDLHTF